MKSIVSALVRNASLAATLFVAAPFLHAGNGSEQPATVFANGDSVSVVAVGPYVEVGTFQVQVAAKLGQPSEKLANGAWLYHHRKINGGSAEGTVVIRFDDGRVSSLSLVSQAGLAALMRGDRSDDSKRVASNN